MPKLQKTRTAKPLSIKMTVELLKCPPILLLLNAV